MLLIMAPYSEQVKAWPLEGRHTLARFDDDLRMLHIGAKFIGRPMRAELRYRLKVS